MNMFRSAGITVGLLVGLILVAVFFKIANRDHRAKTDYDERQREIRGNGYRYAFYTLVIYDTVLIFMEVAEISLPVELYQLIFGGIVLAGMVLAGYTVWNAIPVIGAVKTGGLIRDGRFQSAMLNVICLVMLVCLGVLLLLREYLDKKEAGEE